MKMTYKKYAIMKIIVIFLIIIILYNCMPGLRY